MIPPLWPWKILMLPARGPRPTLKGESQLELRLMDDVLIPQVSASNGPDWHFFGRPDLRGDARETCRETSRTTPITRARIKAPPTRAQAHPRQHHPSLGSASGESHVQRTVDA